MESAPDVVAVGGSCVGLAVMVVLGLIALAIFVFWIWMLIDCLTKETDQGNSRLIWTLVIVFLHGLGALLYLLIRRPQRKAELAK